MDPFDEEITVGIVSRLFGSHRAGRKTALAKSTKAATPQPDRDATRRQLLAMAVRDTLRMHGIPAPWVTTETLTAATAGKERGMHLRLILRDRRLLPFAMDVQMNVTARITRLDPLSPAWMAGISWKMEAPEDSSCAPLPDAGYWQRLISNPPAAAPTPVAEAEAAPTAVRAVLDRLLGSGDTAFFDSQQQDRPDFSPTQPMEGRLRREAATPRVAH